MNLAIALQMDRRHGNLGVVDRRSTLSLNEWAVLGLLVERPRHGYDIATELRPDADAGEIWNVPRHAVYRALERLTDLGHVEPRRTEAGDGAPPRTVYGPTRRGRRLLRTWLDVPIEHLRDVRSTLLLKLEIATRLGHDSTTLLARQREQFAPLVQDRIGDTDARRPVDLWRRQAAIAVDDFLRSL